MIGDISVPDMDLEKDVEDISVPDRLLLLPLVFLVRIIAFKPWEFLGFMVKRLKTQKPLHILIDSGSTYNFLRIALVRKMGCKLESIRS